MVVDPIDQQSVRLSRGYRKARDLFLTQQFAESFKEITLLLECKGASDNTFDTGDEYCSSRAPVSYAKRSLRVKIWCLYLSLLSTLREAGSQQASAWIGTQTWKSLDASLRDGSIWQRVEEVGYACDEQALDHEIIIALVTLCLSEFSSSRVAQEKLELLLGREQLDRLEMTNSDGFAKYNQLVELFLLHVLPKMEEWDYARAFATNNERIDLDSRVRYKEAIDFLEESAHRAETQKNHSSSFDSIQTIRNDFISRTGQSVQSQFDEGVPRSSEERPCHTSDQILGPYSDTPQPRAAEVKGRGDRPAMPPQGSDIPNKFNENGTAQSTPVAKFAARHITKSRVNDRNSLHTVKRLKNIVLAGKEYLFKNPQIVLRILLLYLFVRGLFANRGAQLTLTRWLEKVKQTAIMGTKVSYV